VTEAPRLLPGGRKTLLSVGVGATVVAAVYAVVGEIAGYGELRHALAEVHPLWFAAATAGQAVAYAGYALGYRGTVGARGGPRLDRPTALRVVVLGFGGHVVGASAGGLAVSLWALRRAGETLRDAVCRAIAIATLEWLVLAAGTVAASALLLAHDVSTVPRGMTIGWIAAVSVAVVLGVTLTSGRPGRSPERPRGRVRAAVRAALATGLDAARLVRRIVSEPLGHREAILGFAAYWAGDLLTLYAALRAFEIRLGVPALVVAYATGYVVASAPLPLGASGAAEASLTAALAAVGVALAPAALGVLVYRFCTFWLPLLPALAALPSLRRLSSDLDRVAAARRA
jgi:uncharacterized membrane protein YbhN (UPF0104 family)